MVEQPMIHPNHMCTAWSLGSVMFGILGSMMGGTLGDE